MGNERDARRRVAARAARILRRQGGSALVLAAFLAIPALLLGENVASAGNAVTLPSPVTLGAPTDNYFGAPVQAFSAGRAAAFCVVVEFLGVNQATSYVNLGILVGITGPGKQLVSKLHPVPKYGELVFASDSGLSTFPVKFPLSPLMDSKPVGCATMMNPPTLEREAQFRIIQPLFALSVPQAFPNDWYELNDTAYVTVAGSRNPSSLILTSRDAGFEVTANRFTAADGHPWASRISIIVRRQPVVVLYTYCIGVMPTALLIGIFFLIYRHKRSLPDGRLPARWLPGATDVAFGVAATLVAILPLRTVLVPDSLPAPTRLDILFGLQIALLVALSILWIMKTKGWMPAPDPAPGDERPAGESAESAGLSS